MRAIIIDEKDAMALLERLELAKFKNGKRAGLASKEALEEMHSWFHYHVVSWLQEQGAKCIR